MSFLHIHPIMKMDPYILHHRGPPVACTQVLINCKTPPFVHCGHEVCGRTSQRASHDQAEADAVDGGLEHRSEMNLPGVSVPLLAPC